MKVCKKKILFFTFLILLVLIPNIYSQSGWVSTFFNNTSTFSKIVKRDSLNYFAFSSYSKYYFKSSDAGNNWISLSDYSFDSVCTIFDGQFLNSQTGWIVGNNYQSSLRNMRGVIRKTTNGGINWFEQFTPDNNFDYSCLCFLNTNTGWIGSWGATGGNIYKSTNGGNNWYVQVIPNTSQMMSIKFFDLYNGWIMGFNGLLARTTDGGQTWLPKPVNNISPYGVYHHDLSVFNNNEGLALVVHANAGLMYSDIVKTTNGGDNWNLTYSYTDSLNTNANTFSDINFINTSTGFSYGGYNFIIKTTNSGLNWNRINFSTGFGFNVVINTLFPVNNNDIFGAGGNSNYPHNYILKSTNAGLNWAVISNNREYKFNYITFANNNTGFVISDTGRIYRTSNNGNNWNLNFNNNNYCFREISFTNSTTGCVIGCPVIYSYDGRILRTTNSGLNWTEVYYTPDMPIYSLQFSDQLNGWAGCDSSMLLKTTNSGINWYTYNLNAPMAFDINDINFVNSNTGWILGHHYHSIYPYGYERNIIWKTSNGGSNWNIIYDTVSNSNGNINYFVQFFDNNVGFKLANSINTIQKTTNGGVNWFNINFPYIAYSNNSLYFINQNTGWFGGRDNQGYGILLKTTNSGNNWILQFREYSKSVKSIYAFNDNNAWFSGEYSSIYKTTNGGGVIGIKPINNNHIPRSFSLFQNFPNPFNPNTNIKFKVASSKFIKLVVYDILGKEVAVLVDEKLQPGEYESLFEGNGLPSGIYFYSLFIDEKLFETKKMLFIK